MLLIDWRPRMNRLPRLRALAIVGVLAASTLALAPVTPSSAANRATCGHRQTLFCEDFEKLPTGGAASLDWGVDTRHGTLTVERVGADRRMTKALHVHTEGNGTAFMKI